MRRYNVVDAACLSSADLDEYVERELQAAAADNLMVSLHLKATMMKVRPGFGHSSMINLS